MSEIKITTTESTKYELTSNNHGVKPLTGEKYMEVGIVETIDRYDDFSDLKIPIGDYSQAKGETYGIPYNPSVHAEFNQRIRSNQTEAAKRFLKDLRGFGLLADCVGSGKTYEACVVISELAFRGRIKNLLIIVPDEELLRKWTKVVNIEFGMGDGFLKKTRNLKRCDGAEVTDTIPVETNTRNARVPQGAYIMVYDDFNKLDPEIIRTYLFDMIVVDEAHNLCREVDGDMQSMYILSLMMKTKRRNDVPFCLLLTATPHSGNLDAMFNLWYFIRCKGGTPECFKKNGNPSALEINEFNEEKKYYRETICKGASTVAEYIENTQCELLIGMENTYNETRERFLGEFEVEQIVNGLRIPKKYSKISLAEYNDLKQYQKRVRCHDFLSMDENRLLSAEIEKKVNNSYINTVMRSIMVRRKNNSSVARNAHSYFFLPIDKKKNVSECASTRKEARYFYVDSKSFDNDGFYQFFRENCDDMFDQNEHFKINGGSGKSGFSIFYRNIFGQTFINANGQRRENDFIYIEQAPCTIENEEEAVLEKKCEKFVQIINDVFSSPQPNKRVIVFFDYKADNNLDRDPTKSSWEKLKAYISRKKVSWKNKIVDGGFENLKEAIQQYNEDPETILLAEASMYTEGQDLQNGNLIINFEVPVDPLTMDQRIGRVHRLGQSDDVTIHSFATMSRLDGYCLAYFAAIGIMSDKDGDATILSGSNSDKMLALRCPDCKDVSLIYESDYAELLPTCPDCKVPMFPTKIIEDNIQKDYFVCENDKEHKIPVPTDFQLRCTCSSSANRPSPVKEIITLNEFVCENNSGHRIKRAKDKNFDYVCLGVAQEKLSRDYVDGKIIIGCSKLCAFRHCTKPPIPDCELRKNIRKVLSENQARLYCFRCKHFNVCNCRVDIPVGKSCTGTGRCYKPMDIPPCGIFPYEITFNPNYEGGRCPQCGGLLKQLKANTFETFIRARYESDKSFCDNFIKEVDKTMQIKRIIQFD